LACNFVSPCLGHELKARVATIEALIEMCFPKGFLVIGTNSSISSMFEFFWNVVSYYVFFAISHFYGMPLSLQKNVFMLINFLVIMFLCLNQTINVYEVVGKPFLEEIKP